MGGKDALVLLGTGFLPGSPLCRGCRRCTRVNSVLDNNKLMLAMKKKLLLLLL